MKRLLLAILLAGCADAKDLFRPYVPNQADIDQVLAHPWPPAPIDVGLVLGCPANPDGTASPCERCRVKTAVRQFRAGKIRNLIFSGGAAHSPAVEADVMADLAEKRGLPRDHVFREGGALTTWQNLRFSLKIARAHGFHTILFISTADHLPRVRRMARYYGIDDARTAYVACDLDMPPDSEEEDQPPTKTNG
jgi:vancomycin permeability regulator SanA